MSKVLTVKLKSDIADAVDYLLARGKTANPCPLTREEIQLAWNAAIDRPIFEAIEELNKAGYDTDYLRSHNCKARILVNGHAYIVSFPISLYDRPDTDNRCAHNFCDHWPLGEEKLLSFLNWVDNAGQIDHEFSNAHRVAKQLLEFCKTVGQLTRAMPDLINFMPNGIRKELREQRRASTMPYEWAAFPRDKVDAAQQAIAKAYLLPETVRRKWGNVNDVWAVRE